MKFLTFRYYQELEQLVEDCTRFAGEEVPYAVETLARLLKEQLPAATASDEEPAAVPQVDDAAAAGDEVPAVVPQVDDSAATSDETPTVVPQAVDDAAAASDDEIASLLPQAVDDAAAASDEVLAALVPQAVDDAAAASGEELAVDDASCSQPVLDPENFDDASGSQVLDLEMFSPTTSKNNKYV
jgi:hypothetical protein